MDNFNNMYMFKNPIRHFLNLDNVSFSDSENISFEELCWTSPIKFKIFKTVDTQRSISLPNILNYYHAIKAFSGERNFFMIKKESSKKRVSPDLQTGDFLAFSYYNAIQNDAFNLTKYDVLMVLDIKSFYGRIYTHDLGYVGSQLEQRVSSLNAGRTNGLLLGPYLSLYLAEKLLVRIEKELDQELVKKRIKCHYEYFSDDFYVFCNKSDVDIIKGCFSKVFDTFELQINEEKTVFFDYEDYLKNNSLEKHWKKIIQLSKNRDEEIALQKRKNEEYLGHPVFFTQLVYRLSKIKEAKYRRIFLTNFFKTYYFFNLEKENYVLSRADMNNICFIYKTMPEAMLYSLSKVKEMQGFDCAVFREFLESRFSSTLDTDKNEEQVYFYYAIKQCGFISILKGQKNKVIASSNQILIAYYLLDGIISKEDYKVFLDSPKEEEWLQNYHYVLVYDKQNIKLLLPNYAKKQKQIDSYYRFYEENIKKNIPIVKPIEMVPDGIDDYLCKKIGSYFHRNNLKDINEMEPDSMTIV